MSTKGGTSEGSHRVFALESFGQNTNRGMLWWTRFTSLLLLLLLLLLLIVTVKLALSTRSCELSWRCKTIRTKGNAKRVWAASSEKYVMLSSANWSSENVILRRTAWPLHLPLPPMSDLAMQSRGRITTSDKNEKKFSGTSEICPVVWVVVFHCRKESSSYLGGFRCNHRCQNAEVHHGAQLPQLVSCSDRHGLGFLAWRITLKFLWKCFLVSKLAQTVRTMEMPVNKPGIVRLEKIARKL